MNYFDEKAAQISERALIAFGIPIETRYAKADELVEMLNFTKMVAQVGLEGLVVGLHYDSKSCSCSITLVENMQFSDPRADVIKDCALKTISQFFWFDECYHGFCIIETY